MMGSLARRVGAPPTSHTHAQVHAFREIEATGEGAPGSLFAEALQIPAEVMESTPVSYTHLTLPTILLV